MADTPKQGKIPRDAKFYEGVTKLNKKDTKAAWKEFGGNRQAEIEDNGRAHITRVIERESKENGIHIKLVDNLIREEDGYGVLLWRLDLRAAVRRKPPKQKFDISWHTALLAKIREVVVDGAPVKKASIALSEELDIPYNTVRANLRVAYKWSCGESAASFLPHRSMIRPIFELLCELGKKDEVLSSLKAYCDAAKKPSKYVLEVLDEHRSE